MGWMTSGKAVVVTNSWFHMRYLRASHQHAVVYTSTHVNMCTLRKDFVERRQVGVCLSVCLACTHKSNTTNTHAPLHHLAMPENLPWHLGCVYLQATHRIARWHAAVWTHAPQTYADAVDAGFKYWG